MPRITAPNANYNGRIGNVQFANGQAETDNWGVLSYCRRHGYTVEPTEPAEVDATDKGQGDPANDNDGQGDSDPNGDGGQGADDAETAEAEVSGSKSRKSSKGKQS